MEEKQEDIIFVAYDGIANSVFESQVVQPMLRKIDSDSYGNVTLVSFEQKKPSAQLLAEKIPAHGQLHLIVGRKLPFWGMSSLFLATYQLVKILSFVPCTRIIARGPLAGLVASHALQKYKKRTKIEIPLTIQARGLCAEEFRYAWEQEPQHSVWSSLLYQWKYRNFYRMEKRAFGAAVRTDSKITVESVSPALAQYVIEEFGTKQEQVVLAEQDIPEKIPTQQVAQWRQEIRTELGIGQDRKVFVYSGSYKPWQCAPETIDYFVKQYEQDLRSFLLILSQDAKHFVQHLQQQGIPADSYIIRCVKPSQLLKYLSAADYGMLFRKHDVVNWVSRPTKMLEYQAVGLPIIHNDTVAWLKQLSKGASKDTLSSNLYGGGPGVVFVQDKCQKNKNKTHL